MVKVIGFKQVKGFTDGYRTANGFMGTPMFSNACKKASEQLDVEFAALYNKRQASKFMKGKGIVFNTVVPSSINP